MYSKIAAYKVKFVKFPSGSIVTWKSTVCPPILYVDERSINEGLAIELSTIWLVKLEELSCHSFPSTTRSGTELTL